MNKKEAVREIISSAIAKENSKASAKRTYKAMKTLGLWTGDAYEIMSGILEYNEELLRVVPDLAALPELGEANSNA